MKDNTIVSELGQIIDGSIDQLESHLEDKNVGYVHSLIILMENTYTQLLGIKSDYLEKADKAKESGDTETEKKFNKALERLYVELMRIEEKTMFLVSYEQKHSLSNEGSSDLTNKN